MGLSLSPQGEVSGRKLALNAAQKATLDGHNLPNGPLIHQCHHDFDFSHVIPPPDDRQLDDPLSHDEPDDDDHCDIEHSGFFIAW